jgi:hypothetical protein
MNAALGWLVIIAIMGFSSAMILWPAYALLRRLVPRIMVPRWAALAAVAACGIAIWFAIPVFVATLTSLRGRPY